MYRFAFELESFESVSTDEKVEIIRAALEALVLANVFYLRRHPEAPDVYPSGVKYVPEPPGRDNWQDIPRTLSLWASGEDGGDCEDLASWHVAWLRLHGYPNAKPHIVWKKIGAFTLFHIMVDVRGDGSLIADPSKDLGMK